MGPLLQFSFDFHQMECGQCGIVFAISNAKFSRCKEQGEDWFCPNGHNRIFAESEITRLKSQLEAERQKLEWANAEKRRAQEREKHAERSAAAYKGKHTLIKNRITNGVCPCCNRTFQNLMKHMETKHPQYKKDKK